MAGYIFSLGALIFFRPKPNLNLVVIDVLYCKYLPLHRRLLQRCSDYGCYSMLRVLEVECKYIHLYIHLISSEN